MFCCTLEYSLLRDYCLGLKIFRAFAFDESHVSSLKGFGCSIAQLFHVNCYLEELLLSYYNINFCVKEVLLITLLMHRRRSCNDFSPPSWTIICMDQT